MKTYYATAERTKDEELKAEVQLINNNPIISGLLHSVGGLLAVLDERRHIVSLNETFLQALGIEDPGRALGLRLGEAFECVHAHEKPAGCGTTEYCTTCGAAVAAVTSINTNRTITKRCALTINRMGESIDLFLKIESRPIAIGERNFLLLFVQDITEEQLQAALQRTFIHDISNVVSGLAGASELLCMGDSRLDLPTMIRHSARQLECEVKAQRVLMSTESPSFEPDLALWSTAEVMEHTESICRLHPLAATHSLQFETGSPHSRLTTDIALVIRILSNMIVNALEASGGNQTVKVWTEHRSESITFKAWNRQAIDKRIALRIFQRNFSTKAGKGRGLGTYSMKFFGETILGGKVDFLSSPENGTTFWIELPERLEA